VWWIGLAAAAGGAIAGFYSASWVFPSAMPSPVRSELRAERGRSGPSVDLIAGVPAPASAIPAIPEALIDEATRLTDRLVRAFPTVPDALEVRARLLEWLGKSKQAVQCWEQCLQLDPDYAFAHFGIGVVAAQDEDYRKAAESLRQAVRLDPGNFPARSALASALVNLNQPKEVIAVLEEPLRRDPRSEGFFLLGQAYVQMQQLEKARDSFEAAIRKYPQFAEAYYRLSSVYTRLGQQDKSRQCIQKSRELKAEQRQDKRVKKREYDDLNAVRSRVAESYTSAAQICFVQNRHQEAECLWRRAADLAPKNIECRQGLAWLCRQQVRIPEAITILNQLAALQPKDAGIWLEIGQLHADLANFAEAEAAVAHAVELAPANQRSRAAYEAIKKIRGEGGGERGEVGREKGKR
jgi:tetratricopeptide (TPR) repeat protein